MHALHARRSRTRWREQSVALADRSPAPTPERWSDLIRTTCESLALAPPGVLDSCSVSRALSGAPDEEAEVRDLSAAIASQWGLWATVEVSQQLLTIRLSRPKGPTGIAETPY